MSSAHDGDDAKAKPTYSTRVFKKAAPNNKITAYLGRRDFFDTGEKVDVVDGVILVDKEYMNRETGWKVFAHLSAVFRYGREDLESHTGLIYKKDIYSKYVQVYPPLEEDKKITRLQDRLIKKLGDSAYPFLFELPRHLAASVSILPAPNENGKPCGVDYQLTSFVGFGSDDRVDKKNSVKMAIKKLNLMADNHRKQPCVDLRKDFVLSNYPVCIEARLDKELYIHGEEIKLHLNIDNRSSKTLKNLVCEVKQYADITVGGINAQYKSVVAQVDSEVGFPVGSSSHMSQTYALTPSMDCNTRQEGRRGCALDGQYKAGDSNLAASSVIGEVPTTEMKEAQAILVQYKLKAKLTVLRGTDIKFDLPFRLAHSRPTEPVFVRKANDGGGSQYVTVNQAEAANLMSSMSEYTSLKKSQEAAASPCLDHKKHAAEATSSSAGRISGPPAGQTYATVNKKPVSASTSLGPAQPAQPQQPAVSNDLIDLMMFDPTKSATPGAAGPSSTTGAPGGVSLDPLLGGTSQPVQQQPPQAQPQLGVQQNFMMQQQPQQGFGQPGMNFMGQQPQAAFGQPAQPFMQQPSAFGQPAMQQHQPFMAMQSSPGMFGGQIQQQQQQLAMSSSNPFAAMAQSQQQQSFMQQPQMQQMSGQNFMGAQPQQQLGNFGGNFGGAPAQAPAAQNEDDMFFEEFVSMRMDG